MSATAALLILDLIGTYAKSQMELNALMQKAALEGRAVTMDDLKGVISQSDESRSKFDEAVARHQGK